MPNKSAPVKSNFADVDAYEVRIRKFVPGYEMIMDFVLACLPERNEWAIILELACGTGNLSQKVLDRNRLFKLVAIDLVSEMVRKCGDRLHSYKNRIEIFCADMVGFRRLNSFDFVLSNLALHYLETDAEKIAVCQNVYDSLRPGGIFSFSVMLTSHSPGSRIDIWKLWENDVLRNGVTHQELNDWYDNHHSCDYAVPLDCWLKWLEEVGFRYCTLAWSETIFGVIWAVKA